MNQDLREVPINQIDVDDNYRKTFDDKDLAGLARSIKMNGVVQAIVLRPSDGRFTLIAGERRLRASRIAGLVTIPAQIRDIGDEVEAVEIQLIENIQRTSVPYMEEAYGIKKLRDKGTLDTKEIADRLGKSEAYVYYQLRLTAMSDDARRLCEKGWITKGVAWELSKIKDEDQQTQAANDLARTQKEKQISVSGAKNYIRDNFGDSAGALRQRRVATFGAGSNDYAANWKFHLVRFSINQFESFKKIVRGRTETAVLSEAVDNVMRETGVQVAVGGGGKKSRPFDEKELVWTNA